MSLILTTYIAEQRKQNEGQQAAMKHLLAQVHGIQAALSAKRAARLRIGVAKGTVPAGPNAPSASSKPAADQAFR